MEKGLNMIIEEDVKNFANRRNVFLNITYVDANGRFSHATL